MKRKALPFRLAVAVLLTCALPAAAFPPQCSCRYCEEHPDSMCLVGPIFFDCVDFSQNYCPLSTSTSTTAAADAAALCAAPEPATPASSKRGGESE